MMYFGKKWKEGKIFIVVNTIFVIKWKEGKIFIVVNAIDIYSVTWFHMNCEKMKPSCQKNCFTILGVLLLAKLGISLNHPSFFLVLIVDRVESSFSLSLHLILYFPTVRHLSIRCLHDNWTWSTCTSSLLKPCSNWFSDIPIQQLQHLCHNFNVFFSNDTTRFHFSISISVLST